MQDQKDIPVCQDFLAWKEESDLPASLALLDSPGNQEEMVSRACQDCEGRRVTRAAMA